MLREGYIPNCPECGKPMDDVGNLSGVVYTSNPPQWDNTYVCRACEVKTVLRIWAAPIVAPENFDGYRDLTNLPDTQ